MPVQEQTQSAATQTGSVRVQERCRRNANEHKQKANHTNRNMRPMQPRQHKESEARTTRTQCSVRMNILSRKSIQEHKSKARDQQQQLPSSR